MIMNRTIYTSLAVLAASALTAQNVGINTDGSNPVMMLHVKTTSAGSNGILIENPNGGNGDAIVTFRNNGSTDEWTLGFDDSDNDDFKISQSNTLGATNALTIDGGTRQLLAGTNGTAADPVWSFESDDNTGIYLSGADLIGMSTVGTERFRIDNSYQVQAMNGASEGAPFYSFNGDENTGMWSDAADELNLGAGGQEFITLDEGGTDVLVINEDSDNSFDVRMEGSTDANNFFLDGSTNRIGIGTNTPSEKLHVNGDFRIDGDFYNQQVLEDEASGWTPGSSGSWLNTTLSITVTTHGSGANQSDVYLGVSGYFFSYADTYGVRIIRDGATFLCGAIQDGYEIVEESGYWNFALNTVDNPGAGSHTYTVQIYVSDGAGINELVEGYFSLLEIKE